MNRRTPTLIKSPLRWQMPEAPVGAPLMPVLAERGGTQIKAPRATIFVDTREQNPFDFSRFEGWFTGVERKALKLGDYSVAGLEDLCVVERKDLPDLVHSFTTGRAVFVNRLKQMSRYPHRLLVITAALSQVKSPYPHAAVNPNRIFQSLIALLAGYGVPFLCAEPHELGEELVASYLYQVHLYQWLDSNGYGRFLADRRSLGKLQNRTVLAITIDSRCGWNSCVAQKTNASATATRIVSAVCWSAVEGASRLPSLAPVPSDLLSSLRLAFQISIRSRFS